jgi:hypothetical protein
MPGHLSVALFTGLSRGGGSTLVNPRPTSCSIETSCKVECLIQIRELAISESTLARGQEKIATVVMQSNWIVPAKLDTGCVRDF